MVEENLKNSIKEDDEGLPPLDESWWEAVLAEEDKRLERSRTQAATQDRSEETSAKTNGHIEVDWELALELYENDEATELDVDGFNRGGLLVSSDQLQGFVPISHLVDLPAEQDEAGQEQILSSYTGRQLQLKIIECDQARGRVVFSERAALTEAGRRNQLLSQLQVGQCIEGVVTNITDFGVFVDLGGLEGLIHVSEISWGRVRHPKDVIQHGDRVKVHVINVDPERSRIALSIKRLYPNPWETAQSRYFPGQVITATITSVVPFGAFARLEEGLDGLIHISEMGQDEELVSLFDMLQEGQQVQVRVLHVDAINQRLGLSLINEESTQP